MIIYLELFGICLFIRVLVIVLVWLLRIKKDIREAKLGPFECGFVTIREGRIPFSFQFFLVSLIFLIFDVELILLFPYLTECDFRGGVLDVRLFEFFVFILTLGFLLE